jgi:hypothetical protein
MCVLKFLRDWCISNRENKDWQRRYNVLKSRVQELEAIQLLADSLGASQVPAEAL